jgi:hypothetical protein
VPSPDWGPVLAALRDVSTGGARAELLERALLLGHDAAPGTVGCSVTELDGASYRTPAASSPLALELDNAQYADSAGPCVNAARDRQPQQIDVMTEARSRFPGFVAAASDRGIRGSFSVPIAGRSSPSALNLYSTQRSAFASDRAHRIAGLLARVIGAISTSASGPVIASAAVADAVADGARVSAAVARVMREHGVERARAFAVLVARARARGVSLLEVADAALTGTGDDT